MEEFEDPDLRMELSEETNLVVLILRRDEPGWFLRGRGDEVVGWQRFSQRPDGQWEAVARFGPPGQQFEFAWNDEARVVRIVSQLAMQRYRDCTAQQEVPANFHRMWILCPHSPTFRLRSA